MDLLKKILIICLFLVLLSIVIFLWSINQKLEKIPKIKVSLSAPETTKTFILQDFRLTLLNESKIDLKNLNLKLILPDNFYLYQPKETSFNFDLKAGEQKFFDFTGAFLQGEGVFPFKVKILSNQLNQDETFQINLVEEGVNLVYNFPPEIEPGNEFNFSLALKNNLDNNLPLILKISSLPGFKITFNENEFTNFEEKVELKAGEKRIFNFTGVFDPQTKLGRKEFKIFLIALKDKEPLFSKDYSVFLNLIESPILITTNLPANISTDELRFEINLKNNSQKILNNSKVRLELIPDYFLPQTIKVSHQGLASLKDNLTVEWSYERTPELLKILPQNQISFSVQVKLNKPKNYFHLEIPVKIIFENEMANILKEQNFNVKVKGMAQISRKIEWVGGELPLKAQKTSFFKLIFNILPLGENLNNFVLSFNLPYWVKATSTLGQIIDRNFYFNQETIKAGESLKLEILLEVTPFLNQVGENIILVYDTKISGIFDFTQEKLEITFPNILSNSQEIENFVPERVTF